MTDFDCRSALDANHADPPHVSPARFVGHHCVWLWASFTDPLAVWFADLGNRRAARDYLTAKGWLVKFDNRRVTITFYPPGYDPRLVVDGEEIA